MTITEFLEARITEDEAVAREIADCESHDPPGKGYEGTIMEAVGCRRQGYITVDPARVLAECAAKRAIVHYCTGLGVDRYRGAEVDAQYRAAWWISVQLAKVYADHPDYRQEWAL